MDEGQANASEGKVKRIKSGLVFLKYNMKTLYSDNAEGRKMVKFLLEISFPGVCYGFYELCSIYLTF